MYVVKYDRRTKLDIVHKRFNSDTTFEDTKQIPVETGVNIDLFLIVLNVTPRWHLKGLYTIIFERQRQPSHVRGLLCELQGFHTTFFVNIDFKQ